MDVLADALGAMHAGRAGLARTDVRAPWGLRFPAITGAGFHVVLQGTCWLLPAVGEPLALSPGDVVFLKDGSAHALADRPDSTLSDFAPDLDARVASRIGQVRVDGPGARSVLLCGAYQFTRARPHPLLGELPDVVHLPARPTRAPLRSVVELLGVELDRAEPGRDGIVPALVDAMLLYILRTWIAERADGSTGWAGAFTDPGVRAALESIHADPARAWTVESLAATAGLSRSVFAQRFTDHAGGPPMRYLTWWRMTLAGRLLHDTDTPLAAVAHRVGYVSEFAFGKAFKREFGIAPGRYRALRGRSVGPAD